MEREPTFRVRTENVAWREIEGETILLDLRTSTYLATNATATLLWRRLEQGGTESDLVAVLVAEFEVPEGQAAADVSAFLADCRERDLVAEEDG
jgi:hypothetical protein